MRAKKETVSNTYIYYLIMNNTFPIKCQEFSFFYHIRPYFVVFLTIYTKKSECSREEKPAAGFPYASLCWDKAPRFFHLFEL